MSSGLLSNSTTQVQVDLEAIDSVNTAASVQAVTLDPGVEGGRKIKAQVYVTPPDPASAVDAYSRGIQYQDLFTDGTIAAITLFSDGTIHPPYYTLGALLGKVANPQAVARFDLTVTIKDIAFEQLDLFGGSMSAKERAREANKF